MFPKPIENLIQKLAKLPGVGEKTALRLVLHILENHQEYMYSLANALCEVAQSVQECAICCNLASKDAYCQVCQKKDRDSSLLCIVSSVQDLVAIEKSNIFSGYYHVLHGLLQPICGIGPHQLRFHKLNPRLSHSDLKEVIIATPSSVEGEATALYVKELVLEKNLKISRIASGIPVGGDLQYADKLSLNQALSNRHIF